MLDAAKSDKTEDARILLDLLSSVERDGDLVATPPRLGARIALGLVNAYLRRCVERGWSRSRQRLPAATSTI